MTKANSTTTTTRNKPSKPYPEFPLYAHPSGQWAKKIRGHFYYFGAWADPDAALTKYLADKDALHAGRKPRPDSEAVTIKDVANHFLIAKQALVDAGELSPRTWADYKLICDLVVKQFGKNRLASDVGPDDFSSLRVKMAKRWGPERLGSKLIQYTCSLFKHAFDARLIATPVCFGPGFKRPSRRVLRVQRAERGPKLFTAEEIRRLLESAGVQLKAMILLGINCGFGNADCAALPLSAVDLDAGIIDFPRPKTGIPRRAVLWGVTVDAIRQAIAERPEPKDAADAGLVFITKYGQRWGKDTSTNPLSQATAKLLKGLKINGRKGLGFYTLRHVFRTVADEAKDQPACDFIMGHEGPHIAARYRETIADSRLSAVANYVHAWLFPADAGKGEQPDVVPFKSAVQ
jgi:integrase